VLLAQDDQSEKRARQGHQLLRFKGWEYTEYISLMIWRIYVQYLQVFRVRQDCLNSVLIKSARFPERKDCVAVVMEVHD
jgi:hypothetical protein